MKDLTNYLSEDIINESRGIVRMVQSEYGKTSGYETYDYNEARHKYKKGFLLINDEDFFSITVFNSAEEYAEQMNVDPDSYSELESLHPGDDERVNVDGQDLWAIRLW